MQEGHSYVVKGSIYNPHPQPVRNVVIRYYVWKKFLGREGFGSFIKDTGGMVQATIRYVPPRTSVDFLAGGGKAPIQLNVLPDPLGPPDIAAEWDD